MVATDENKWRQGTMERQRIAQKGRIPLEKLATRFAPYNRNEGKSPKTILWYSRILRYFGDYLRGQSLADSLDHLDVDVVREYILHLQPVFILGNG
jgi:hypothetical protein